MVNKPKLVSVLTPCYNAEKYIHRLLDSILEQTHPRLEMYIIDDGSTDRSAEIIQSYIPKFERRGYKLNYVYQTNQGRSYAVNRGLKLISGDYLLWPDSDDYYSDKSAIQEMVNVLDASNESVSMVRVQYCVRESNSLKVVGKLKVDDETRYKTDLFEDCLLGQNGFWYPPGGKMIKVKHMDMLIPGRDIYVEKNAGQNVQILLPLLYGYKCLTLEKYLFSIVERPDSVSRNGSTNDVRQKAYRNSRIKTLKRMNLPVEYETFLVNKINKMYRQSITTRTPKLRIRIQCKRLIKALLPHGVVVLFRRVGV